VGPVLVAAVASASKVAAAAAHTATLRALVRAGARKLFDAAAAHTATLRALVRAGARKLFDSENGAAR